VTDLDRLVYVYVKIRDKKNELAATFAEQEKELDGKLDKIKQALLEHCKATGTESVKTASGTFWRTQKKRFWTSDWDAMNRFIVENEAVDLLEKRIHQGNMKQFLEENPEVLPPGLNADSEYSITVRRKK
jgi:hypothetical protein